MNFKHTIVFLSLAIAISGHAQQPAVAYPHKFKEIKLGATLDAVREHNTVRLYMVIDNIDQYDEISIERSDEHQQNFDQCKLIEVQKGKYKNNYLEAVDQYPLPPKMGNQYRIKTVTSEGITRMYPPVPVSYTEEPKAQK
jgi:hypothetical protein